MHYGLPVEIIQNRFRGLTLMYESRTYRHHMGERFHSFLFTYRKTDLWIGVDPDSYHPEMEMVVKNEVTELWRILEEYSQRHPKFITSLEPIIVEPNAPEIVRNMAQAVRFADVGPMAAVAGAFSQAVGQLLDRQFHPNELMVENGGDIYAQFSQPALFSVFAGQSPLSEKVGITVLPEFSPLGICTSAGTVGPSLSFGKADAVMIACRDTLLADAYATAFGNKIKSPASINPVIEEIKCIPEILSAVIICQDKMGVCGKFELAVI